MTLKVERLFMTALERKYKHFLTVGRLDYSSEGFTSNFLIVSTL